MIRIPGGCLARFPAWDQWMDPRHTGKQQWISIPTARSRNLGRCPEILRDANSNGVCSNVPFSEPSPPPLFLSLIWILSKTREFNIESLQTLCKSCQRPINSTLNRSRHFVNSIRNRRIHYWLSPGTLWILSESPEIQRWIIRVTLWILSDTHPFNIESLQPFYEPCPKQRNSTLSHSKH